MARRKGAAPTNQPAGSEDNDEAVLQGGPGDEENNPAPQQNRQPLATSEETAEIEVGGQKYTVPKAVADAHNRSSDMDARLARMEQRLTQATTPPTTVKQPRAPATDEPDWENLILTDTKKAVELIKQQAVQQARQEMTTAYTTDQATRDFWNGFYNDNPALKPHKRVVTAVFNDLMSDQSFLDMPGAKAAAKLAEECQKEILSIARSAGGGGGQQKPNRTRSEGGSMTVPRGGREDSDNEGDDGKVHSLTSILKQRAALRRGEKKSA